MTGLPESILPTLVYMGLLQVQRSVERVVDAPEVAHGTDARARGVVGMTQKLREGGVPVSVVRCAGAT